MAKRNIAALRKPPPEFDPAFEQPIFETLAFATEEDGKRCKSLERSLRSLPPDIDRQAVEDLLVRLSGPKPPRTLASSRHMRRHRRAFGGATMELVAEQPVDDVAFATVIPKNSAIPYRELAQFDVKSFMMKLRSALSRAGSAEADGFIVAAFHGEYVARDDGEPLFQPHIHLIACGGMREVIERLRLTPTYRSKRTKEGILATQRIRMTRKPLTDLPAPLTYCLQSYWPAKWVGIVNGREKRVRQKHRLPDHAHTQMLLWLDAHTLSDLTFLVGVRIDRNGRMVVQKRNPMRRDVA